MSKRKTPNSMVPSFGPVFYNLIFLDVYLSKIQNSRDDKTYSTTLEKVRMKQGGSCTKYGRVSSHWRVYS